LLLPQKSETLQPKAGAAPKSENHAGALRVSRVPRVFVCVKAAQVQASQAVPKASVTRVGASPSKADHANEKGRPFSRSGPSIVATTQRSLEGSGTPSVYDAR